MEIYKRTPDGYTVWAGKDLRGYNFYVATKDSEHGPTAWDPRQIKDNPTHLSPALALAEARGAQGLRS